VTVTDLGKARSNGPGREIPADLDAEEQLLGAMLSSASARTTACDRLVANAFHKPAHAHIFSAVHRMHQRKDPVDPVTVADELRRMKLGLPVLAKLHASTAATSNAKRWAKIIDDHYVLRRMIATAGAIQELGYSSPEDVGETIGEAERLVRALDELRRQDLPDGYMTLDAFLRQVDEAGVDPFPWLVPDIIKREHRCVIVGPPGSGKSMILQQIAVCAAAGLHPFNDSYLERPLSVLLVDAENPQERIDAGVRPMHSSVQELEARLWKEENCHLWMCPAGIDLTRHSFQAELENAVRDCNPDLVLMGPAYKLAPMRGADANEVVARVMSYLDNLRTDYQFGLMIETHPPRGDGPMRAFGSAQWEMWPELSFTLEKVDIDSMEIDERGFSPACFEIGNARPARIAHGWPKVIRHRWPNGRRAARDGWRPWVVVESEDPNAF
jgi:hypothetical protein